jgi:hypothetical protein
MRGEDIARRVALYLTVAGACGLVGCSDDVGPTGPAETKVLHPDAAPLPGETTCEVVEVTNIPVKSATHVPDCTSVAYGTNPPSGGDHWGEWAAFRKYTQPVQREMYVHDMEHGAVVLAFRCEGSCPEVETTLGQVFDEASADPLCVSNGAGPKARLVLTPDPKLDTPIAAMAWGATYTATCIDKASLAAFVADRYGKGSETTCAAGIDVELTGGTLAGCAKP